jgi:hypothetical protein
MGKRRIMMAPKQHLERMLATEGPGSPTMKALIDMVSLQYTQYVFTQAMDDEESREAHQMMAMLFDMSMITETIRKRSTGKHARAYNKARDKAQEYFQPYYDEQSDEYMAKRILDDLMEIVNKK